MTRDLEKLGTPDLQLVGFQLWAHNRQFPNSNDYWDSNWLNVTAHCGAEGASVWTNGSILHLGEVSQFLSGLKQIYATLQGEAELPCMEPELNIKLRVTTPGKMDVEVHITPNIANQEHCFHFEIDQSYLPGAISGCEALLSKYPIKNATAI